MVTSMFNNIYNVITNMLTNIYDPLIGCNLIQIKGSSNFPPKILEIACLHDSHPQSLTAVKKSRKYKVLLRIQPTLVHAYVCDKAAYE